MAQVTPLNQIKSKYLTNANALYTFLTRPLPKEMGVIKCKIKRKKVGMHLNFNKYYMFLEKDPQLVL